MESIIKLFTEYQAATIVIILVLLCLAIKGVIEFVLWIKDKMESWRKAKNMPEEKEEVFIERISDIETRINKLEENDENNVIELEEIKGKLNDILEHNKQQTIIMSRGFLLRLCEDIKERGYMRPDEYETFEGLSEGYIQAGGNSLFKNRIIPEIEAMEVRTGD